MNERPITDDARTILQALLRDLDRQRAMLSSFIAGLRLGMDIPTGWEFDLKNFKFVEKEAPPDVGK